ncbi:MarR family transcriptional regulator [Halobacteriales archaeon QS_4_70_19]|jgi:DNA-binding transcriptional ArsR family regulator|nr:MAG: MarR family transcriptional regulator [Halobacteriales archaeon QS_4_70_19]
MQAKPEYRDRDEAEVGVLDALVDRHEEGMTVFELRSGTDLDIDAIETALGALKEAGLIRVDDSGSRTLIFPDERVVPDPGEAEETEPSFVDRVLERLPL